jgi:glutamine synthetase type III
VIPAGERQLAASGAALAAAKAAGVAPQSLEKRVGCTAQRLNDVVASLDALRSLMVQAEDQDGEEAEARFLADQVRPAMAKAREAADHLEHQVDDDLWSLPKYREMLFVK